MKRALNILAGAYAAAAYCFIYLPVAVLVLFSFQATRFPLPPFSGPSLRWYGEVLGDAKFTAAMWNSVTLGLVSSAVAVLLGFLSAYGCARMNGRAGGWVRALLIAPLSVSYLIIGMGLVVLFNAAGVPKSLFAVGIGHVVINLPLCFARWETISSGWNRPRAISAHANGRCFRWSSRPSCGRHLWRASCCP